MDFRVPDRATTPPVAPTKEEDNDAQSLLSKPFPVTALKTVDASAAIRKLPDGRKTIEAIGPDHLRALATASTEIRARAESLRVASALVERRLDLQVAEYSRQLKLLREAAATTDDIRTRAKSTAERAESMAAAQTTLVERLDSVLNAMLAEYRPQIGEVERKWFDELERVRQRVAGARRMPGLAHRAKILQEQLDVVRPLARTDADVAAEEYGQKQLRPLQAALGARSEELARMLRKMEALDFKVEEGSRDE